MAETTDDLAPRSDQDAVTRRKAPVTGLPFTGIQALAVFCSACFLATFIGFALFNDNPFGGRADGADSRCILRPAVDEKPAMSSSSAHSMAPSGGAG